MGSYCHRAEHGLQEGNSRRPQATEEGLSELTLPGEKQVAALNLRQAGRRSSSIPNPP